MLIKYQSLTATLDKQICPVFVLLGQDHYLLNEAAVAIKNAWRRQGESDETSLVINNATDWSHLIEEANNYSLFTDYVLLDVRFEKKSIDASGKAILAQYLSHINPRTLIILRAPNVSAKQLNWLTNHTAVCAVQIYPLTAPALQSWILRQLQQQSIRHEPDVPALILQYTQGNMLACAQVIEKILLTYIPDEIVTKHEVLAHLIDQCEYQLFELSDACLAANGEKAIHLLRKAYQQNTEPTLILWLLTQDIRLLIQLQHSQSQSVPFSAACSQFKIWPQRANLYKMALSRISLETLYRLLQFCQQLDERIKTSQNNQIWQAFDQVILSFCITTPTPFLPV